MDDYQLILRILWLAGLALFGYGALGAVARVWRDHGASSLRRAVVTVSFGAPGLLAALVAVRLVLGVDG